ncbi:DNA-binding protein [Spirochaetia bacterium]|nr:DNA-binding protein [Spirochaetia bacterium]
MIDFTQKYNRNTWQSFLEDNFLPMILKVMKKKYHLVKYLNQYLSPILKIILYQPDNAVKLEVRLENDTVWLTQAQTAGLFGTSRPNITMHLRNIFGEGELQENAVSKDFLLTAADGKKYQTKFYNLDAILSVGYRVNSINATQFRQWATRVLKEYLLKGYAINQRFERIEQRLGEHDKKIDFFVRTALPPVEGVFYDGQIFDAYIFVADLIKSAKKSITLIDNYVDESVLTILSKRNSGVDAIIYTPKISPQLQLDLQKHNAQYPPITVKTFNKSHDRFIIVDDAVYHIGASLKDLGKKWFAFTKMMLGARELLEKIV